jgi:hypothetical protein
MLPSINVPGVVIHFDASSGAIVTRDLQERLIPANGADDCDDGSVATASGDGCRVFPIELSTLVIEDDRAVRSSRIELDPSRWTRSMAVSDSRVFYLAAERERPLSERTRPDHQSEALPERADRARYARPGRPDAPLARAARDGVPVARSDR